MKCKISDLIHIYILLIRSILETSCQVFHSQLTEEDSDDIERIQKIVARIILGDQYIDYSTALPQINLEPLKIRREKLCLKFALKCLHNKTHSSLFVKNVSSDHYHRTLPIFVEPTCGKSRYQNSPVPYLTKILNKYFQENPVKASKIN